MPAETNNTKTSPLDAAPLRHAISVALTLGLNAGIVLLLVTWAGRHHSDAGPAVRATPLSVVEPEPEPLEPITPEMSPETPAMEVPPEPMLPAVPQPVISMPTLSFDAPAPIEPALHSRMDMPAFEAESEAPLVVQAATLSAGAPGGSTLQARAKSIPARGPMLMSQPDLSAYYPRRALARGVTGKTQIRLIVDDVGRVTNVQVVTSHPAGVFEHAAGRVGRALSFRPAMREGKAISAVVFLNLVWKVE